MTYLFKTAVMTIALAFSLWAQTSIRASKPTHYFYVPTSYLNPPYHLVISLHEISFSLPSNLQLHMSLFDNVGRINFGARYGFAENLSVGAGIASTFISTAWGHHGIHDRARLGLFLAWGISNTNSMETCLVPHTQIGNAFSIGVDFALKVKPSDVWSVIWEAGTSADLTGGAFYINTDLGLRIHPPKLPFLSFDIGIDVVETNISEFRPPIAPYFDVIFAFIP